MTIETLWQHWTRKKMGNDCIHRNELNLKIGQILTLDILDFRFRDFVIEYIEEHIRGDDEVFHSNDYILNDKLRLRMYEKKYEIPDQLLQLFDEFPFDEGFLNVIEEASSSYFNVDGTGFKYTPVGDQTTSAYVKVIKNQKEDVSYLNLWTFERIGKDEAGQDFQEVLFIDQDRETGWFRLWLGTAISRERVIAV